jgi:hypothetical protein
LTSIFSNTYAQTIQIGSGALTSSANTITPWTNFFEDGRGQYLITAAELAAQGLTNGDRLYSLTFNVISTVSQNTNVTISMKSTTDTNFASFAFDNTGFTTVFSGNHTPSVGWDIIYFNTSYLYDGNGIIINFCFNNTSFTGNSSVEYSTTTPTTHRYAYTDNTNGCILSSFGSNTNRANMQFSTVPDTINPRITSITRQNPAISPTNADVLVWDVTFDETVSNVDATDFTATGTTATVTNVTNPSGNVHRVTVSGGDLAGLNATVTLGFAGGQNITDVATNALVNLTPTGTNNNTFVVDNTAPRITSITRQTPSTSPTNANALIFRIIFDKSVNNVNTSDFTVTGTTATVINVSGSGTTYDITIAGGDLAGLNGTVTLGFAGGQNIADNAGNGLVNFTPTGTNNNTFVINNGGASCIVTSPPAGTSNTWMGCVNSDWANGANWTTGLVPTTSDVIYVPNNPDNPLIINEVATCAKMVVEIGGVCKVDYNAGGKLIVKFN